MGTDFDEDFYYRCTICRGLGTQELCESPEVDVVGSMSITVRTQTAED